MEEYGFLRLEITDKHLKKSVVVVKLKLKRAFEITLHYRITLSQPYFVDLLRTPKPTNKCK